MLLEHGDDHGAHRNNALALIPRRVQRFLDKNGRQATSAVRGVDLGVVEDALIATVGEVGEADGLAIDGNGVPTLLRGDLVGAPVLSAVIGCSVLSGVGRGRSRVVGSGGAGSRVTEPR